jgi:putative methyltransferase (TIGR04325 family)
MHLLKSLHTAVDRSVRIPGVRHLIQSSYVKAFINNKDQNLFHGVFDSFDAAAAAASGYGVAGYDNQASAALYLDHMRVDAHDYPAMFWLGKSFLEGMRNVFDVGGSIGIKYYAFAKAIPVPGNAIWTVEDVPAAVTAGESLARERGVTQTLHFTDQMSAGDGIEILFASGSLQYLPHTLAEYLGDWSKRPRRIVINTTPIHPTDEFFTVNSIGTAFCAYRVQTQARIVKELGRLGYKMLDYWANRGKEIRLPLHPDLSLDHYKGFCFERSPA